MSITAIKTSEKGLIVAAAQNEFKDVQKEQWCDRYRDGYIWSYKVNTQDTPYKKVMEKIGYEENTRESKIGE